LIGIINYGLGNVLAIANIYKRLNIPAMLVNEPAQFDEISRIILPGVGAFDWAMSCLTKSGMKCILDDNVINQKKPVLGICVGMQMMAQKSEEGKLQGLGWIEGEVRRFNNPDENTKLRLPHMGWNELEILSESALFEGLDTGALFYFLHSYYLYSYSEKLIMAYTEYHGRFTSCIGINNIYGVQFHPEKSHLWGIQLLKNFAEV